MSNDLLNLFGMFRKVRATLKQKLELISHTPSLLEWAQVFFDNYDDLKLTAVKYKNSLGGKTKDKHHAIDEVVDEVIPIKAVLKDEANKNHDEVLFAKVNYSPSILRNGLRDDVRTDIIENILTEAEARPTVMAKSNITAETIAAARTKLNALYNTTEAQDTGYNSRKALRIQLNEKIKNENNILRNHIDELIELVKKTDKETYDQYFAARVVVDLGGNINIEEDEETPPAAPANK